MTEPADPNDFKSYDYGLAMHALCMDRNLLAFNELFALVYSPLLKAVERYAHGLVRSGKRRYASDEAADEAVIRAVYDYKNNPANYNPDKGKSLYRFLLMAAEKDYLNEFDKELRQTGRWDPLDSVDIYDDTPEQDQYERHIPADVNIEELVEQGESRVWVEIRYHLPDARDQLCAYYMLEGVRDTIVFVDIYDLHHLPLNEQDHVVKKNKDRIKKKLGRNLDPEDFRNHD